VGLRGIGMSEEESEILREIERRNMERDRRERLFAIYEMALISIAQGHERPVELALKTLMGAE